ncbi:MAG: asparagine synthase (glutamine-hydrolyzing) [Candidatus Omnitrophota bacterium]|jgi:asparagine synthase (glutamine-hydrolysing)
MCGIVGKINRDVNDAVDLALINRMCAKLIHRGPDDKGLFHDSNFACAMRRLSIIDIDHGQQPIFNEDKSVVVVCNGEIYNFKELREALQKKGHSFSTEGDTEVIVHAYEEYGESFVSKLEGMFAIALWDVKLKKLVLVRDRLGIKPLYYYADDTQLVFGSEIKAILEDESISRDIDQEAMMLYLRYSYIPHPYSIIQNIKKVSPGQMLIFKDNELTRHQYWDLEEFNKDDNQTLSESTQEFRRLFEASISMHLRSDVPVGVFLSGGIDSSAIVAMMSRLGSKSIKTFSIGFKDAGYDDESRYAEEIVKIFNTDHTTYTADESLFDLIKEYVVCFDEPFADYAALPTLMVSKLASKEVKVVLTGDGADEVFGGYKRYVSELWAQKYKYVPATIRRHVILPCVQFLLRVTTKNRKLQIFFKGAEKKTRLMDLEDDQRYNTGFFCFDDEQISQLMSKNSSTLADESKKHFERTTENKKGLDFISKRLYGDMKMSLPEDMLTKVDRVTMSQSIEARVPFLDHKLVEFGARIPSEYKVSTKHSKIIVREAMKGILPESILKRPKHGFSLPLDQWMRSGLKTWVQEVLAEDKLKQHGFFNSEFITTMVEDHLSAKGNYCRQLFTLIAFQLWYEEYVSLEAVN